MHMRPIANVVLPILVRAYERSEQTQEIKYNSVTRAGAYVRSGPPCDSHCEPQCLRLWHREVYCEACGVTSCGLPRTERVLEGVFWDHFSTFVQVVLLEKYTLCSFSVSRCRHAIPIRVRIHQAAAFAI